MTVSYTHTIITDEFAKLRGSRWSCGCVGGADQSLAWVAGVPWVHKILAWVSWVAWLEILAWVAWVA